MANLSDFGKSIKIRLIEMNKTQRWLVDEVKNTTGLYFDDGYLYKLLVGLNNNPTMVKAIKEILDIEE